MADWNETIQSMNKTDELLAEITRLRKQIEGLHGELISSTVERNRLRALVAEAAAVIKPFAEEAPPVDRHPRENTFVYGNIAESDLRAAAQWMEKSKTDG